MSRNPNKSFWATRRAARNKGAVTVEPATTPADAAVTSRVITEPPTPETATKAELIAAAEKAGIEVKASDTKADIAAKLNG